MTIWNNIILYISSLIISLMPMTTYREGIVGQPQSYFPHQTESPSEKTISGLIYRSLFAYDIYGALEPDLAEKYEVEDDGLVYVITLKKGQKWDDGSEIQADDLMYTAFKDPILSGVATDRVDDYTVRYTLPNKFSPFPSLLTNGVMKKDSEENMDSLHPTTSGKFRIVAVKKNGPAVREVVLYNKSEEDPIRKLVFKYYPNEEELIMGAKLGEIDGFAITGEAEVPNFERYRYPMQGIYYSLMFNLRNELFQDTDLRTKMRAALPIEELIAPYGIPVQGPISKNEYTLESIKTDYYDNEIVDELLPYEFVIKVPNIGRHEELAKRVDAIWEDKFDFSIDVDRVDPEKFVSEVIEPRDFDVLFYGLEVGRDPDRYVYWHSTQKDAPGLNITGFEQVRADRALEEGRNNTERSERMIHYNEFQEVIENEAPAIFLYHPYINHYVSKFFTGIGDKYTFDRSDRFFDFENWKRVQTN